LGIERCGKIHAVNSVSESWTGIGVVAGVAAVMLITQGPHVKNIAARWGITWLHILQEVRSICKTRNHLYSSLGKIAKLTTSSEIVQWFMSDSEFEKRLGQNVYPNPALAHIFLALDELLLNRRGKMSYSVADLVKIKHIPPDLVVERVRRSLKAS
jgi:hypothetical protein